MELKGDSRMKLEQAHQELKWPEPGDILCPSGSGPAVYARKAAALSAGFPVKLNTVMLRGLNDHEAPDSLFQSILYI